jgi:hypothetical protein
MLFSLVMLLPAFWDCSSGRNGIRGLVFALFYKGVWGMDYIYIAAFRGTGGWVNDRKGRTNRSPEMPVMSSNLCNI